MNSLKYKALKPVLKWAGGKRQIINQLIEAMPKKFNKYYEPFIGAGALFFEIKPDISVINDINLEISNVYTVLSNKLKTSKLVDLLKEYENKHNNLESLESKSEFYYQIRALDRLDSFKKLKDFEFLARTIYLNKACFNGIFRLNSDGYFNVPFGKRDKVNLYDRENIESINNFLSNSNTKVLNGDFESALKDVEKGDFVYFDPPYDVIKDKNSFTTYSKEGFGKADQERLAKLFIELDKKGAYLMLSNHNTQLIRELYSKFNIKVINAKRVINSKSSGRGNVEEVLITNYE
jgi:DNA adenine methylase